MLLAGPCVLCAHDPDDHVQTVVGVRCIASDCRCRFYALELCHPCGQPIPVRSQKKSPLRRTDDHVVPLALQGDIPGTTEDDYRSTKKRRRIGGELRPAHLICNGVRGAAPLDGYVLPDEIRQRVARLLAHQHPEIHTWRPCNDEACRREVKP